MRNVWKNLGVLALASLFAADAVGQFGKGNLVLGTGITVSSEIGDKDISGENFYVPIKSKSLYFEVDPSLKIFLSQKWSLDLMLGIGHTSTKNTSEDVDGHKSEGTAKLMAFQGGAGASRYLEIKESLLYFGVSAMLGLSTGKFETSNSYQKQISDEYFINASPSLIVFLFPKLILQASVGNLDLHVIKNTLERINPPGYLPAKETDKTVGFDLDLIPTSISLNLQYLIRQ
ncbi:hypothetical protein [uncultured Imperialibacter sp.]|uniref:outer membrane protein n=1 Tax=uncultured Imperialibacter sp. TaxID=1672639 RepID=UPI0030DD785D|tara:strand:+ start:15556 stop:16248 length:693 start_codon:yes stop_codon:yes gene_type:complete